MHTNEAALEENMTLYIQKINFTVFLISQIYDKYFKLQYSKISSQSFSCLYIGDKLKVKPTYGVLVRCWATTSHQKSFNAHLWNCTGGTEQIFPQLVFPQNGCRVRYVTLVPNQLELFCIDLH